MVTAVNNIEKRYAEFKRENPKVRIRDAARSLDVSEAELLATGIGKNVVRLEKSFKDLLQELFKLGRVMGLTRNDEIVHERKGVYENAQTEMPHGMALFVNPDIDLRIFTRNWHHAFAAEVENARAVLRSIQIFDHDGSAIHKIYLTPESNLNSYEALVKKFKSKDQTKSVKVARKPEKQPDLADSEIDVEGLRRDWSNMKDTHDFFPTLGKYNVGRKQALRLAGDNYAREVSPSSYKWIIETARDRKVPIMVFVGNDGIIQIHTGEIENVVEARGWFNIMDEAFNLHIDKEKIGAVYIVRKPTSDGIVTSLELFNSGDKDVALFFGKRKPGVPERADWKNLIADLEASNA